MLCQQKSKKKQIIMKIRDLVLCGFLALSLSSFAQEATSVIERQRMK
jgi:hypothetical protein